VTNGQRQPSSAKKAGRPLNVITIKHEACRDRTGLTRGIRKKNTSAPLTCRNAPEAMLRNGRKSVLQKEQENNRPEYLEKKEGKKNKKTARYPILQRFYPTGAVGGEAGGPGEKTN